MKKSFEPFFNYPENSINDELSIMSAPLNLNNVDDFNSFQKNIFIENDNQFNDYDEENEEVEDDFACVAANNCFDNYEEPSNFANIFSFENESKEAISHINIENENNKEIQISQKVEDVPNFSGDNYNKKNIDELNSSNSKACDLKDNEENKNKLDEDGDKDIIGEPVIEINISNEVCEKVIDNNISNKKFKKLKTKCQNLEIDYDKQFQLFNKGTNNHYVNEIINSINNKNKQTKKIFKIDYNEKDDSIKLIGKKRNKKRKRGEKPDGIRKKLKSRFHKIFTEKLNGYLKAVNSEKKFCLMPQIFISNIAIKQNKEAMNMKLKDLFRKNFVEDYKEYKPKYIKASNDKYLKNLNTLDYLEKNIDIQEKSKFNIIGEMKYFEILEEFFYSEEFEDTVIAESKKKPLEYVKDYVKKARTYVKFFLFSNCD